MLVFTRIGLDIAVSWDGEPPTETQLSAVIKSLNQPNDENGRPRNNSNIEIVADQILEDIGDDL